MDDPRKKVAPVVHGSGAAAPRGAVDYRLKCTRAESTHNGAEGKVAQKTKSGHKVKCGSTAPLFLEGSIFGGLRADNGAILQGISRWAQKNVPCAGSGDPWPVSPRGRRFIPLHAFCSHVA